MSDILTIRIEITDKEKVQWLWDNMRDQKSAAEKHGCVVTMLAWGDPVNEDRYVLDRIDMLADWRDRSELFEEMQIEEDTFDTWGQLSELVERWTKEARALYGSDVTAAQRREHIQKQKQLKLEAQRGKENESKVIQETSSGKDSSEGRPDGVGEVSGVLSNPE